MLKWLVLVIRVTIGCAFVYAGVIKIQDPSELAITVASFQILPNILISPLALTLPPFEIISGVCWLLVSGDGRRRWG